MTYKTYLYLFTILLLNLNIFSWELSTNIDKKSLTVGESVSLIVRAISNKEENFVFPGPEFDFKPFQLLDIGGGNSNEGNSFIAERVYKLALYQIESASIPSINVYPHSKKNEEKFSDSVFISIKAVNIGRADSADIVDISKQKSLPPNKWFYLSILAIICFIILLIFLFRKYFVHKDIETNEIKIPLLSPLEQYNVDILDLNNKNLLGKALIKDFHLEVSEILRRYLGARLNFYALESTTTELLDEIKKKNLGTKLLREIENFALLNDPVKFAKLIPSAKESEELLEILDRCVYLTRENNEKV